MRRRILCASLVVVAFATTVELGAGDVEVDGRLISTGSGVEFPDGSVQTTAATSSVFRTPITALPFDITSAGSYQLTSNVSLALGTYGIMVSADDVTIDLNGFLMSGAGGSDVGIQLSNADDVEIRNGTIQGFGQDGIGGSGDRTRIINMRMVENGFSGVSLEVTDKGHLVQNSTVSGGDGTGISLGHSSTVRDCVVINSGDVGIRVRDKSTVESNTVDGAGEQGIFADDQSRITDNTVTDSGDTGIRAEQGSHVIGNTVIHNNLANDTGQSGIRVFEESYVFGNHIQDNLQHGLLVEDDRNVAIGNTMIGNSGRGLKIDAAGNIYDDNRLCNATNTLIVGGNLDGGNNLECP